MNLTMNLTMNLAWMIFFAGIGTYLMRSAGVWLPAKWVPTHWLTYLPLAVILVMAVASLHSMTGSSQQTLGTLVASAAVAIASWKKLPLAVCIAIGCVVFGAIAA